MPSMTELFLHMTPYNPWYLFYFDFQTATVSHVPISKYEQNKAQRLVNL